MIRLNVRHDLDRRRIVQERTIRLVGLGDENIATTQVRAGTQLGQNATHGHRRIQPARRQPDRQHAGRRRLSVRTGDADETHTRSRQGESLRPVNHQLTALTSNRKLRVLLPDRSRHDDHRIRVHVRGIMPDEDTHAHRAQVIKNRRLLAVRAHHGRTTRREQLGDDAHAGASDANQMKTILQRRLTHGRSPSPVPGPDRPVHEQHPHAPETAKQPPCPPSGPNPAGGTRWNARSQP